MKKLINDNINLCIIKKKSVLDLILNEKKTKNLKKDNK